MEGGVPLENFLDSFQSSRKTFHVRRAQLEKIQEAKPPERKQLKLLRADRDQGPGQEAGLKETDAGGAEHRLDGVSGHGPARVFQLRYGLTPAILVPLCKGPGPCVTPSLTDSGSGHGGPHARSGRPVGLRVIGQLPGWPVPPVHLHRLYRTHQNEPPYR